MASEASSAGFAQLDMASVLFMLLMIEPLG
jgi:hypothetical protein